MSGEYTDFEGDLPVTGNVRQDADDLMASGYVRGSTRGMGFFREGQSGYAIMLSSGAIQQTIEDTHNLADEVERFMEKLTRDYEKAIATAFTEAKNKIINFFISTLPIETGRLRAEFAHAWRVELGKEQKGDWSVSTSINAFSSFISTGMVTYGLTEQSKPQDVGAMVRSSLGIPTPEEEIVGDHSRSNRIAQAADSSIEFDLLQYITNVGYAMYHIANFTGKYIYENPSHIGTKPLDLVQLFVYLGQIPRDIANIIAGLGWDIIPELTQDKAELDASLKSLLLRSQSRLERFGIFGGAN